MNATTAAPRRWTPLMPLIVAFIILAIILTLAALLSGTVYTSSADRHAVWLSADIAFGVQFISAVLLVFLRKWNVMAAWGITVLLRFAALAAYGFSLKSLGLPATPALISLVTFFFVTTLAEPWLIRS